MGGVTIQNLGELIIRRNLIATDKLYVNQRDFDNIVLEHRKLHNEPLQLPLKIFDVSIEEDLNRVIGRGGNWHSTARSAD